MILLQTIRGGGGVCSPRADYPAFQTLTIEWHYRGRHHDKISMCYLLFKHMPNHIFGLPAQVCGSSNKLASFGLRCWPNSKLVFVSFAVSAFQPPNDDVPLFQMCAKPKIRSAQYVQILRVVFAQWYLTFGIQRWLKSIFTPVALRGLWITLISLKQQKLTLKEI